MTSLLWVGTLAVMAAQVQPMASTPNSVALSVQSTSILVGETATVTVTVLDAGGNRDTAYRGTVALELKTGTGVIAPNSRVYGEAEAGRSTFEVTFDSPGARKIFAETSDQRPSDEIKIKVSPASTVLALELPETVTAGAENLASIRVFGVSSKEAAAAPSVFTISPRGLFTASSSGPLTQPGSTVTAVTDNQREANATFRIDQTGAPVELCAEAVGVRQCGLVTVDPAPPAKLVLTPGKSFPVIDETVGVNLQLQDAFGNAASGSASVLYELDPAEAVSSCRWQGPGYTEASGGAQASVQCDRAVSVVICAAAGSSRGCADVDFGRKPGGATVVASLGESAAGALPGSRVPLELRVRNVDLRAEEPLHLRVDLSGLELEGGELALELGTGRLILPALAAGEERQFNIPVKVTATSGTAVIRALAEDASSRPMSEPAEASLQVGALGLDLGGCQSGPGPLAWVLALLAVPAWLRERR
ncbi:MAG TPA: hypothetical protein VEY30_03910 [Myxococcaceae bacterium]|nr:hypothetical protein [Myxococcaceae bacterium]